MGIPVDLFLETDIEEFLCSICQDVFEEPMMIEPCDHIFCKACIDQWRAGGSQTCPVDRQTVTALKKPLRAYANLLNKLKVRCPFHTEGCTVTMQLDAISGHRRGCDHNPDSLPQECADGCGARQRPRQRQDHNCVAYLKEQLLHTELNLVATATQLADTEDKLKIAENSLKATEQRLKTVDSELAKSKQRIHELESRSKSREVRTMASTVETPRINSSSSLSGMLARTEQKVKIAENNLKAMEEKLKTFENELERNTQIFRESELTIEIPETDLVEFEVPTPSESVSLSVSPNANNLTTGSISRDNIELVNEKNVQNFLRPGKSREEALTEIKDLIVQVLNTGGLVTTKEDCEDFECRFKVLFWEKLGHFIMVNAKHNQLSLIRIPEFEFVLSRTKVWFEVPYNNSKLAIFVYK